MKRLARSLITLFVATMPALAVAHEAIPASELVVYTDAKPTELFTYSVERSNTQTAETTVKQKSVLMLGKTIYKKTGGGCHAKETRLNSVTQFKTADGEILDLTSASVDDTDVSCPST